MGVGLEVGDGVSRDWVRLVIGWSGLWMGREEGAGERHGMVRLMEQ